MTLLVNLNARRSATPASSADRLRGFVSKLTFKPAYRKQASLLSFAAQKKHTSMRKVILGLAVSLDGFIEGPSGEYDWCFTDQDYGMSEFFAEIDSTFVGRKTFEMMQQMPDQGEAGFPKLTEYVFSNSLERVNGDTVLIKGDIREQVMDIKRQHGKHIWLFGGAGLTTSLMNLGLVDELWLSVHPVLLGSGKPLFSELNNRITLQLLDSKTYNTGLVSLRYTIVKQK
jgi:dihydrofolate reductase